MLERCPFEQRQRDKVAANLARARKKRGLTQEQVAARVGVKPNNYWRWEHAINMPSAEHMAELEQALDLPEDYLWTGLGL